MHLKFTDASIRALPQTEAGQAVYTDDLTPGLSLQVGKRTKTFMFLLSQKGRRTRQTLGRYDPPHFTLAMAREQSRKLAAQKILGLIAEKEAGTSYADALADFFIAYRLKNRASTVYETDRLLQRLTFTGDVADITTKQVLAQLDAIKKPSQHIHAFRAAQTLFNWFVNRRLIPYSPLAGITPPRESSRERILEAAELVELWRALERHSEANFASVVRLCILTAQRVGQIVQLRGEHIVGNTFSWPAEAMKGGKRHSIPITPMVAAILPDDREGLLFAAQKGGVLDNRSNQMEELRELCPLRPFTLHDCRRTWATIAADELDTPPHIIESVLAHNSGTRVSRIYNRAKYIEPMRTALLAFEEWLQALLSTTEGTNVRRQLR